jgi:hypothetical protein
MLSGYFWVTRAGPSWPSLIFGDQGAGPSAAQIPVLSPVPHSARRLKFRLSPRSGLRRALPAHVYLSSAKLTLASRPVRLLKDDPTEG